MATAFSNDQLHNIQGFGIAGFRKDYQELLFLAFEDPGGLTKFLTWANPRTASAWEVGRFNEVFSEVRARTGAEVLKATWMATMVSAAGLRLLGAAAATLPPGEGATAFAAGMAARAANIGDTRPGDAPGQWRTPFRQQGTIHALLVVAADESEDLAERVDRAGEIVTACHGTVVFQEPSRTLLGDMQGHEHFGFKDGGSQPVIDGYDDPPAIGEPPAVAPGEFVLGYPDTTGAVPKADPSLTDSSLVVFRRLTPILASVSGRD